MNEKQLICEVLKKHKFQQPVSEKDQDKILKSKKNALKKILRQENAALFFPLTFNLYFWLRNLGLSISFKNSLRLAYASSGVLAILLIAGTSFIFKERLFPGHQPLPVAAHGHVISTSGNVSVQIDNQKYETIGIKDIIKEKSTITTGPKGSISIQLAHIGVIRLLPGTTASFQYIDHNSRHIETTLSQGALFSNVLKNFGGVFNVKTPACNVIARGTQYLTTYINNTAEIKLLEGKVGITTPQKTKEETALTENHSAVISKKQRVEIRSITIPENLALKKLSLQSYIPGIESKTKTEIEIINRTIQKDELKINKQIILQYKQKQTPNTMSPLDRLRKQGKPLTMFHLRDRTRIAGCVVSQTKKHILLDTGDGIVKVPIDEVIRRLPLE